MLDRLNQQSSYYRVHKNSSFSELCLGFILDLKHNQLNITRHTVDTSCQYLICMDLTFVNINVYIRWCVYDVVCNNTYRKYKGSDTCTTPYAHDLYTLLKIHIYIYIYIQKIWTLINIDIHKLEMYIHIKRCTTIFALL